MTDKRTAREVQAIKQLCEIHGLDVATADDPKVDLLEVGRRINFVLATRRALALPQQPVTTS